MNYLLSRCFIIAKKSQTIAKRAVIPVRSQSANILEPPDDYIELPRRTHRGDEDLSVRKARLLYQSRKRGMLENDLLLSSFADKFLRDMTLEQVEQYDTLINQPSNDWEIYYWATGMKPVPHEYDNEMFKLLKEHVQNKNRENRLRQPNITNQWYSELTEVCSMSNKTKEHKRQSSTESAPTTGISTTTLTTSTYTKKTPEYHQTSKKDVKRCTPRGILTNLLFWVLFCGICYVTMMFAINSARRFKSTELEDGMSRRDINLKLNKQIQLLDTDSIIENY